MKKLRKLISLLLILCSLVSFVKMPALASNVTSVDLDEIKAQIISELRNEFGDEYTITVDTYYVSKEYLEELEFNSRQTNWFGYYLADIYEIMDGEKWVFTVSDGETIYQKFEPYDDTYDIALRNVAIGAGVIILCVTVSLATGGVAPAISAIFAVAAKTGTSYALVGGAIGATIAGAATAYETNGDMEEVLKSMALKGSEGFMWGAISGAAIGGISETAELYHAASNGLTMNEAAMIQKETQWSAETISKIQSMEEYNLYKAAGLKEVDLGDLHILLRDIDLNQVSELGGTRVTNLERMIEGYAPVDPTGLSYHVHHVNQETEGLYAILTAGEHQSFSSVLHTKTINGVHSIISDSLWTKQRKDIWMTLAKYYGGV